MNHYVPVPFQESDLALALLIASKLKTDPSQELRNALATTMTTTTMTKVALDPTPLFPDEVSGHRSGHRGPDVHQRKPYSKHPNRIEDYILEQAGQEVTAPMIVKIIERRHKITLNVTSVSSILGVMWRKGQIQKLQAGKGNHQYLIKPKRKNSAR
jgi:hypothetical protein